MTTLSLLKPHAVAALLEEAERIHIKNGHATRNHYNWLAAATIGNDHPEAWPVDMFGAVLTAAFGAPRWPDSDHPAKGTVRAAEAALKAHLATERLDAWSDRHTKTEVRTALRETAAGLRGGAA